MACSHRHSLLLALLACTLAAPVWSADMPKRKSGLWEIKTEHEGAPGMTMQMCIDEKQDDMTAQEASKANQQARKMCPKLDVRKLADRIEIDSVCKLDKTTATGHTVISGQMATQYRMEATTRFDPPMHGMAQSRTVMNGRWLGPCKPGQSHGSMTFSGMPGGGQFKMDPEAMKQMRKMQHQ